MTATPLLSEALGDVHQFQLKRAMHPLIKLSPDIFLYMQLVMPLMKRNQKFLNLYWKVSWLLNRVAVLPIHCPFDSIIIKELDFSVSKYKWTKLNTIKEYIQLVEAARNMAKNNKSISSDSIAEWELKVYIQKRNKIGDLT